MPMGKNARWDGDAVGIEYQPFLDVRTPSHGKVTRIAGIKTGRLHHLLSGVELQYFYLLEWLPEVVDIREQYALPLDETEQLADELRVSHPAHPTPDQHVRMTSDFVVTYKGKRGRFDVVRSCKPSDLLASNRTLEKLEIERRFWARLGVEWKLVTERTVPQVLVRNIEMVHPYTRVSSLAVAPEQVEWLTQHLEIRLRAEPTRAVASVCSEADERSGFDPGSHMALVRHAVANRRWAVDIRAEIKGSRPLPFLGLPAEDQGEP
jgi:hypothetical protein